MTASTAVSRDPAVLTGREPTRRDASEIRRRELSAFLRSRRERITPAAVGLPVRGKRRTPGLRREEVARLAGVGASWYTWLEQGRDIKVSSQVLGAIARSLQLDADERMHLFTLAEEPVAAMVDEHEDVTQPTLDLLDHMSPYPALVQNGRYDILAYNAVYGRLIGNLDEVPPTERNCMWLVFTEPRWRRIFPDWEAVAAAIVSQYRALMAGHVAEPSWTAPVKRLRAASPEFAELWDRHEVNVQHPEQKRFLSPDVGLLNFSVVHTWLQPHTGTRMLTYVPADESTNRRVRELADLVTS